MAEQQHSGPVGPDGTGRAAPRQTGPAPVGYGPQARQAAGMSQQAPAAAAIEPRAARKQARRDQRRSDRQVGMTALKKSPKAAARGAKLGGKIGSAVPVVGNAAGAVVGAGVAVNLEQQKAAREAGNVKMAFFSGMGTAGLVGGAINAKLAHDVKKRMKDAELSSEQQKVGGTEPLQQPQAEGRPSAQRAPNVPLAGAAAVTAQAGARVHGNAAPGTESASEPELGGTKRAGRPSYLQRARDSRLGRQAESMLRSPEFKQGAARVGRSSLQAAQVAALAAKRTGASNKAVAASAVKAAAFRGASAAKEEYDTYRAAKQSARSAAKGREDVFDRMDEATQRSTGPDEGVKREQDDRLPVSQRWDYQFEDADGAEHDSQFDR